MISHADRRKEAKANWVRQMLHVYMTQSELSNREKVPYPNRLAERRAELQEGWENLQDLAAKYGGENQ